MQTVEEAATEASISRYGIPLFAEPEGHLVVAHSEIETPSFLPADACSDPEERLLAVVTGFTQTMVESELQQRTMLRLSLKPDKADQELLLRQGRAIGWFEEALSPLVPELGETGVRQLAFAVGAAVGIESLIWLTDVAGMSRHQASEVMPWSTQALLHHALADGVPGAC